MDGKFAVELFRIMVRIRAFELAANSLYMAGKLHGFLHTSIGQEATSTGACMALRANDYMATTHRGHGDVIAKGLSIESAMAELFGRSSGACHGKGGSMHLADFSKGILGANGIVAAGIPVAAGAALSAKYRQTDDVALAFFGDGAVSAGPIHETLNIARLLDLPLIFVRQNNLYAQTTPIADFQGIPDVISWAASYGMPAVRVDGNDVLAVFEATREAVERARRGKGPSFIECETYRWHGHNVGDAAAWRPREEVSDWKSRDPIEKYRTVLLSRQVATPEVLTGIERSEQASVATAVSLAEAAPGPGQDAALADLYVDARLGDLALRAHRP